MVTDTTPACPIKTDALTWEDIPCPLCNAQDATPFLHVPAEPNNTVYHLVRCRSCSMVYMNPRPTAQCIGQFYADDYQPYCAEGKAGDGWWGRTCHRLEQIVLSGYYHYPPALTRWSEKVLAWLARPFFGPDRNSQTAIAYHGEGRLLDYGCGSGRYLARMRQRGWTVTGMDFSDRAVAQARKLHGLEVHSGTLPHAAIRPESFDVVTMGAVLEHVHWPHRLIAAAAEALRPGGLLVVSVPNLDALGFELFGEDWWPLEIPRHLLHFTPQTLRRLLLAHGLEVLEVRPQARGSWMRRSLERCNQPDRPMGWRLLSKLGKLRLVPSLLTSLSEDLRRTDGMMAIARRPRPGVQFRITSAA